MTEKTCEELLMDSARAFLTVTRERDALREQVRIDFEAVDERIRKQSAQIEEQAKRLVTANARLADQDAILAVMPTEEEWARMERELGAARKVVEAARGLLEDEHINLGLNDGWGLKVALEAFDAGNASDQVATTTSTGPVPFASDEHLEKIRAAHAYHREIGLRCVICFLLAELEAAEKVRQAQVKQLVERVGTNAATVPSSSLNESGDPVRTTAPARVVRNVDIATKSANPDTARVFATFSEHPPICEQCGPGAWGRSQRGEAMKLKYRGQIDEEDGKFIIVGCHFDAEGGPVNLDEMLRLVREAWNSDVQHEARLSEREAK